MNKKQIIYSFLHAQIHCVISTVTDNKPESALIGFGEAEDLSLIFGTDATTRKYKNIQKNPQVAFTIGMEFITVQYEGNASLLAGKEQEMYKKFYFSKTPSAKKYEGYPNQVYFKVVPTWIRYSDYNKDPEEIFEIEFK